ncbi:MULTISPECIES: DNA oxidative demethylase AlkB [Serratia]|uniref:DNA oxidative demethylase AlkB n=1 Tax=Serratia TaxID=613 RepID=UPI000B61B750|nr:MULTISPECIES: DNA oxidative demethylase AlkB [Serratia]ASM22251.1 alpha-ketoglutarate-dependent dioxygenase AlkB [Serratia marcescens]ASM27024.1 alpha-ketoglutarate-dependent dioxygenase AlkB [Serratia marcescens]MBN5180375.1 DNA oxidative demethylase AlkB [Serratia marcescens]
MTIDLFEDALPPPWREEIAPGAVVMHGFVRDHGPELLAAVQGVVAQVPWQHLTTPGGHVMSVAMSWCGNGWTSDSRGYRYSERDARSGKRWPAIPPILMALADEAARQAGFGPFVPDSCLMNRYDPGSKLSLHQDKDEHDFGAPIVSVSLGLPAVFQFGGLQRSDRARRIPLAHGDVVVWGGPSRLCFHGILPVKEGYHSLVGPHRINITLRKAL